MSNMRKNIKAGFTMIELVMVLTIISLLLAAAIAGSSLINESRLQSVVDDVTRFRTAIAAFKLKYNQFPGDYSNAFAYFGTDCANSAAECNGNGNGRVEEVIIPRGGGGNEVFRAWQHMNLADILTGGYSGSGARTDATYTGKLPLSKYQNSVYGLLYFTSQFGKSGNALFLGSNANSGGTDYLYPSVRVGDAKAIDRKMDDGIANQGFVYGVNGTGLTADECSAIDSTPTGADYNLANSDNANCRMIFWYDKTND